MNTVFNTWSLIKVILKIERPFQLWTSQRPRTAFFNSASLKRNTLCFLQRKNSTPVMAIASSIAKAKFWQKGKGIQQLQKNFKVNDRFLRERRNTECIFV